MDSPSQNVQEHGIEYAMEKSEINSVLTCIAHIQGEAVRLDEALQIAERVDIDNDTLCAQKYDIATVKLCMDGNRISANCIPDRPGRSIENFIITISHAHHDFDMGKVLELLEAEHPDMSSFGILIEENKTFKILSGGGRTKILPAAIVKELDAADGQILYVTQYSVAGRAIFRTEQREDMVRCSPNEIRIFRFGKWQCAAQNEPNICIGDNVWDATRGRCVEDMSRRPLCAARQTAVMVDYHWICMDPLQQIQCPPGQFAHMDYSTLEWTCTTNPGDTKDTSKCDTARLMAFGRVGTTLRLSAAASCSDCEELVIDPETCAAKCVPDARKITNRACYAGECSGASRAFYFGFPDASYITSARPHIPEIANIEIPMTPAHSRNRKFNCLDCGTDGIDRDKSKPPFVAVCN